ncbi:MULTISPECIES: pyrroloquinoline quinone biosynthesis protein PqqF [unclassified Pseudomonas]|uniref:pyrroloquinoline quinone biosynthesis protein PqqF n=1 Tax=unclassified Pseudomonas TaxID=196821 RepID=UPI0015A32698|nr:MULTISPECIES: pyrroloquinoline quinone biosynthesis protein PqqF [unclassified Pseudomonas]NWC94789.1 pyrroloquinoline quinone biosynthesis protein PqqF [Pseudomonas sp. IPO3779]NWD18222.1 pyrroloquinoline quinone biosynthesis protein PqqF [Pseudomonas sp. IPO3778]
MPAPAHPHYLSLTLANGLQVSLRHAPRLKRCAAALRVAAGSHDVPLAWPGLAHFLEHLLFLGTERFPAHEGLMAYVQRQGGQVNASTRERTTDFFFEVPVAAFEAALERLGDMLAHPRLTIEDQLREREVLQAEFIAWSQDAAAQQQQALLEGVAADHPLRAFHAGNRDSLPVEREGFQHALRDFYEGFYQTGQMTLSLAGPQSLAELEALAQQFGAVLKTGPLLPQKPAPALLAGNQRTYQHTHADHWHQVVASEASPEALDFLCLWLNASAPGGLLAELQSRQLASALNATRLYQFAGQALLDIQFTLGTQGAQQTALIEELLHDWLSFFAHCDWTLLREEFALLFARKQQVSGALALARQGNEPVLSEQSASSLKALLASLQLPPSRHAWQLPPANPFLRPAVKEERPGLIRGQTSAHRGLRTFAQDRSRGRRDLSALTFSQAIPDDADEGAIYLHWQLDSPLRTDLFPYLRENASQAGVELSFETIGNHWQLKMVGAHEPMPALLEEVARGLTQLDEMTVTQSPAVPTMAIRQLLKALPEYCAGVTPAHPAAAQDRWSTAHWQGLAVALPAACEAAIKSAAGRLPGQPANVISERASISGQHLWHDVSTDSSDAALLLFCPTPTQSLADEACWRLLGHLIQAPLYQRLRVELQLGYAVFSGIRQFNGQTGLLFGVQSPSASLAQILDHLQTFLKQLPALINGSELPGDLARQFSLDALTTAQAADLLWHAHLAGHPSDYIQQLQDFIQTRTHKDLMDAAQQLNGAAGGWRCVANGACPAAPWQ